MTFSAVLLGGLSGGAAVVFFWAQYHRDAAWQALERYNFKEATHHLDLCLKVLPRSASVHLLAAQIARRSDAYDDAERHLAQCIQLGGMTPAVAQERMLLSAQQGELDDVEASLRGRIASNDLDSELVLEALAKGYANRFWYSQALECLDMLLERQPRHPQALLIRAQALEKQVQHGETERRQDVLNDYEKAVEANPTREARLGLARALYRVGRTWEAVLLYRRLFGLYAADPEVQLGLARSLYNLHEVEEAQRLLDELLEQYPHHPASLLERGRMALHSGQLTEALSWLRQAADAAPRYDAEAQRLLCRCLEAAHETAEAQRCREDLGRRETKVLDMERRILQANRNPQDVALRYEIATELMALGREQDAVAALFFVLEQQPGHGPARQTLAEYFERTGQISRAARYRRGGSPKAHAHSSPR